MRRLAGVALLLLAGCGQADLHRFAPGDTEADARRYLRSLQAGSIDSAIGRLHPALLGPDVRAQTTAVGNLLAAEQGADSAELIGAESNTVLPANLRTTNLTFQFHRDGRWMLANVAFLDSAETRRVVGLNANPIPASLQSINKFSMRGRTPLHYLVASWAVVAALLSLAAFVYVIRRARTRRWLWAFVAIVGVGRFALNWTDGSWHLQPLAVQLFGAGAARAGPFAPWVLVASLPLGALIAVLAVRRQVASYRSSAT